MKYLKLVLLFLLIGLCYLIVAPFFAWIMSNLFDYFTYEYYSINKLFPSLIPGFFLFNYLIAHFTIRWHLIAHLAFALFASIISSYTIDYILSNNLYPRRDSYGVKTAIVTNAAISIVLLLVLWFTKCITVKMNNT